MSYMMNAENKIPRRAVKELCWDYISINRYCTYDDIRCAVYHAYHQHYSDEYYWRETAEMIYPCLFEMEDEGTIVKKYRKKFRTCDYVYSTTGAQKRQHDKL